VNEKDQRCLGCIKKIVRMLKNLKADSDNPSSISVNSYEIAGLVYHFEEQPISFSFYQELALIAATRQQLDRMIDNKQWTMGLITPDGIRKIIDSEAKFESLKLLRAEVNDLQGNLGWPIVRRFVLWETHGFINTKYTEYRDSDVDGASTINPAYLIRL
jgi:hypothetical protein